MRGVIRLGAPTSHGARGSGPLFGHELMRWVLWKLAQLKT